MKMNERSSPVDIEKERSWVMDIENKLAATYAAKPYEEEERWKNPSIFRLPPFIRKMKQEVFTPQVVALGPYHHHNPQLTPLEPHKERAFHSFLRSAGKPLGDFVSAMDKVVQQLQDSYYELEAEWKNQDKFLKLMITDGCFMLEVMRLNPEYCQKYAQSDPFFGSHALQHKVPYIRRDMMILENQVPLLVLQKLVCVEKDVSDEAAETEVTKLILGFLSPKMYMEVMNELSSHVHSLHGLHALDLYRRSILFVPARLKDPPTTRGPPPTSSMLMRSAMELNEAGITFMLSTSPAFTAIKFDSRRGILTLPQITVDDSTEFEILNMVALEHLHAASGSEVSSFVVFMDALLDSGKDVQLLHRHGVIHNGLGSDKDVAKLFSSMGREVIVSHGGSLGWVQLQAENYCRRSWNRWRALLMHQYFRNPWSSISVFAATLIILLTIVSTIFSILQWKRE
ncbi:hypothetical protein HPP92_008090 [Vanilla planifolia]|uniref:Uncharacterized protein n=1 Tax=Vanilla planifolia TaxID=51239 RepID=A0A835V6X3_VANPL|nr:hypothetical protein HPP92_008090 [Vanilla planifolia]